MRKNLLRFSALCLMLIMAVITKAQGAHDPVVLIWDYTENAPSANPDNGLYYGAKVSDAAGTNNGLKGIKMK